MPSEERLVTNEWQGSSDTEQVWINLSNIEANDGSNATCGSDIIASISGTRSKPAAIGANTAGFNIHQNSRIDSIMGNIQAYVKNPSGGTTGLLNIPYVDLQLYYANGGAESSTKRWNTSVPSSATYINKTWVLSEIPNCKPAHVNSASFGLKINPGRNTNHNTGRMYIDYASLKVTYTNPTYSLAATITSSVTVGDTVYYTVTLTNTNGVHQGYNIPVSITIPSGLTYVSSTGNGTYNSGTGKWSASLSGGTATLNMVFTSTSIGNKTVTSTVDYNSVSLGKTVNVLNPTYTLTSTNNEFVDEGSTFVYTLTIETDSTTVTNKNVTIPVPDGCSYSSSTGDGTYTSGTGVWAASFTDQEATMAITFTATTAGVSTITATVDGGSPVDTSTITILETTVTTPFYTTYTVPSDVLSYLVDGEEYTYSWYCMVSDTSLTSIYDGEKNFKIGVFQDATEVLSDRPTELDVWTRCSVSFTYDAEAALSLRLYGQYLEISPETASVFFAGFVLVHGDEIIYQEPGTVFDNPDYLLYNAEFATASIPANSKTLPVEFNDINWAGRDEDPDLLVKGVGIRFDYINSAQLGVVATLIIDGEEEYQSVVIEAGEGTLELGGDDEKWDFLNNDILLADDVSFKLEFINPTGSVNDIQVKNAQLVLYTQYDETNGNQGFTLDSEHSKYYNIFVLKDTDKDEGGKPKNQTLSLDGSDGVFVTGMDIKDKSISIKFKIWGDTLEEAQDRLNDATEWLSNTRNSIGVPIERALVFDWDTEKTYYVILDDVVSAKMDISSYECTAKFMVPSGVALSDEIVSGPVGSNDGLTIVKPVITCTVTTTGANPIITESESGQYIIILDTTIPEGTILTIDVANRTITGSDGETYSTSVSLDSTWPVLTGDFDFRTSTNVIVNTVTYREGY